MKKTYYLFNPGRVSRRDNTLKLIRTDEAGNEQKPKYLPVEGIAGLYIFGSIDANSALFNFLGKQGIPVHFFDYYEHYTGSFHPKEYLLAGKMQIAQTKTYLTRKRRMHIATNLIEGASFNMLKNLKYYHSRKGGLKTQIENVEGHRNQIKQAHDVPELMGIEGNIRQEYYKSFDTIIEDYEMGERERQPPGNEINALISFGNMMSYTLALDQIYHTQLNPTISFLHEPGFRRYSLALDIAEIFKPILVDRVIFKILNRSMVRDDHFERRLGGCFLKENGKKVFIKNFDERLNQTIKHRALGRSVSYKRLVRLECYKIAKYALRMEDEYKPFKIWW